MLTHKHHNFDNERLPRFFIERIDYLRLYPVRFFIIWLSITLSDFIFIVEAGKFQKLLIIMS